MKKILDILLNELNTLIIDIENYNSNSDIDIFSQGDILEVKRFALLRKAERMLYDDNVISVCFKENRRS